jgi:hypothetical protein
MTRETTVGIVVSCSFLCLVGIVVANKMRENEHKDEPIDKEEIVSALEEPKPASDATGPAVAPMPGMQASPAFQPASPRTIVPASASSPEPPKIDVNLVAAAGKVDDFVRGSQPSQPSQPSERTTAPPPPPIAPTQEELAGPKFVGPAKPETYGPVPADARQAVGAGADSLGFSGAARRDSSSPSPAAPPRSESGTVKEKDIFVQRSNNQFQIPIESVGAGKDNTGGSSLGGSPGTAQSGPKALDAGGFPIPAVTGNSGREAPSPATRTIVIPDPPPPAGSSRDFGNPSLAPPKKDTPASDSPSPSAFVKEAERRSAAGSGSPVFPIQSVTPATAQAPSSQGSGGFGVGSERTEPHVGLERPMPSGPGLVPGSGSPIQPRPEEDRPGRLAAPTSTQVAQAPSQPFGQPGMSAGRSSPPLGSSPSLATPPVSSRTPQVESFDEETYRVRPGDTFFSISQSHYQTENYAQALVEFTRNHPLTSDTDRQQLPKLRAGQSIYVPPTSILEKRYATTIRPRAAQ